MGDIIRFPSNDDQVWAKIARKIINAGVSQHAADWMIGEIKNLAGSSDGFDVVIKPNLTQEDAETLVRQVVQNMRDRHYADVTSLLARLYKAENDR